jgi:uncharacterized protein YbjT (DUF2867 family)
MSSSKVLIVGASGGVGGAVLRQLLALPTPPSIRVSTRDPAKATFPSSVEVVQGDLEDSSSYSRLFKDITHVFLYAKAEAPLSQLLAAIKNAGVKRIVLLSTLTIVFNPTGMIATMHCKVEKAIEETGIPCTFLHPGNFCFNSRQYWAHNQLRKQTLNHVPQVTYFYLRSKK